MTNFAENIRYFLVSQKYALKSLFAYRLQASLWMLNGVIQALGTLLPIFAIYQVSSGITGWSFYQIMLLSGATSLAVGTIFFLVQGWEIIQAMQKGGIDIYLLRPFGSFTIFMSNFSDASSGFSTIFSGAAIFTYAAIALHIGLPSVLVFIAMFCLGMIALMCFFIAITLVAYHLFRRGTFLFRMISILSASGNYPLNVFGRLGIIAFTVVFPIGLAYYYPASTLVGSYSPIFIIEFIIGCVAMVAVCYRSFYYLLRQYSSGGG